MSVASEWARVVAARQRPTFQMGDTVWALVTDGGELHLASTFRAMSAEAALEFGRWLVNTFGEDTT